MHESQPHTDRRAAPLPGAQTGTASLRARAPGHGRPTTPPPRRMGRYTPVTAERRQGWCLQPRITGVVVTGVVLALLVGVLGGGPAGAQPDFTNVTDILYGRRHLLHTDDLVVAYQAGGEVLGNLLLTDTSQITSNTASSLDVSGGTLHPPTVTAARMFDTPYDVAVSAALEASPLVLHWSLDARPADGSPIQISGRLDLDTPLAAPFDPNIRLYSAAADFTGDGLDEILFVASFPDDDFAVAFVATAVDPTNPTQGLIAGPLFVGGGVDGFLPALRHPRPMAIDTSTGTPRVFIPRAWAISDPVQPHRRRWTPLRQFHRGPPKLTAEPHRRP